MNGHVSEGQLNDYVDDLLSEPGRRAVEAHLAACTTCAAAAQELRALMAGLAALPGTVEPPWDERPAIHARIEREAAADRPWRAFRELRYPLAAAALVLVILSSAVTALVLGRRGQSGAVPSMTSSDPGLRGEAGTPVSAAFAVLERDYVRATQELLDALEERRDELDPALVALLDRNLRAIDRAIHESRVALGAQPDSDMLVHLLRAGYEQKLGVLRRAAALTVAS